MLAPEKVLQATEILKELNVDLWLTFVRETSLNGDPSLDLILGQDVTWQSAFLIASTGESVAIVGSLDAAAVRDVDAFSEVIEYVESVREPLLTVLERFAPRSIAINFSEDSEIADGLSHGMYLLLERYLAGTPFLGKLCSSERVVSALRERKSGEELRLMKSAIAITLQIYDEVGEYLKPGLSEKQVAAFMARRAKELDVALAWGADHCPSVFTGPDTAGAHYGPTDRRVEPGHIVNMDFGVKYQGYCSDLQRTFYVLRDGEKEAPEPVQRGFDTLLLSIRKAFTAMRPGVSGREIDAIARRTIVAAGYDEYPHALGHQVGRVAHDGAGLLAPPWDRYGQRPDLPLEVGQVYTIEPRLTVPGHGVVTIEEEVLVDEEGARWLSTPQETLFVVRG